MREKVSVVTMGGVLRAGIRAVIKGLLRALKGQRAAFQVRT
tara:strand:- start:1205 stop:1327 length:123 start_codon:yes stop_codon:yes gene_type:complete